MMKYLIVSATLILGAFGSSSLHKPGELASLRDGRIFGGTDAPEGSFPFIVSLRYTSSNTHLCGGSIIGPSTILTAAHCVRNILPSGIVVVAGTHKLSSAGQRQEVSAIISHDRDDIAILKLATPLQLSATVNRVKLAEERVNGNINCDASGWGRTSNNGSTPDHLQYVNLKTLSESDCKSHYEFIKHGEICTLTRSGEGTCFGDSGSPLVINQTIQIGIVAWGRPCAVGYPDVYTRVSTYFDWINENI